MQTNAHSLCITSSVFLSFICVTQIATHLTKRIFNPIDGNQIVIDKQNRKKRNEKMMMMIMKMRKKRRKTLQNFAFLAFYCVLFFYIPHCGIINLKGNQPLLEFAEQSTTFDVWTQDSYKQTKSTNKTLNPPQSDPDTQNDICFGFRATLSSLTICLLKIFDIFGKLNRIKNFEET